MGAESENATGTETGTGATGTGTETGTGTGTESTTGTGTETGTATGTETETTTGAKDALQADLVKERKRRQELQAELEKIQREQLSETERKIAEARDEGLRAGAAKVLPQLFAVEVARLASGKLADPDVLGNAAAAQAHLNLTEIPVRDDGTIDSTAITTAIDALLVRKPTWSAAAHPGDGDQGPGGGGSGSKTETDLGALSMEEYRKVRRAESKT